MQNTNGSFSGKPASRPQKEAGPLVSSDVAKGVEFDDSDSEDFETLFNAMPAGGIYEALQDKELVEQINPVTGASGKQIDVVFRAGMEAKAAGLYQTSSDYFLSLIDGRGVSVKIKFLATKNMADIARRQAQATRDPDQKGAFLQGSFSWFQRLDALNWDEEPVESKIHTAIQYSGNALDLQSLPFDQAEKVRRLEEAYQRVVALQAVAPTGTDRQNFALHTATHFVAKKMSTLAPQRSERKKWTKTWLDEAEQVLDMNERSNYPNSQTTERAFNLSRAYALATLGFLEDDPKIKRDLRVQSFEIFSKQISNAKTGEEHHAIQHMSSAASLANQIARSTQDPKEKEHWFAQCYFMNKEAIGVTVRLGMDGLEQRNREYALDAIIAILSHKPSNEFAWTERRLEELENYADFMSNRGEATKATGAYISAVKTIDQLLGAARAEKKLSYVQRRMNLYARVADVSKKASAGTQDKDTQKNLLIMASDNFLSAANDARVLGLASQKDSRQESYARSYHDFMIESGEAALLAGNKKSAFYTIGQASEISDRFSRSKSDETERLFWFQKRYEEITKAAVIAYSTGDLVRTAVCLGTSVQVAQRGPEEFGLDREEWLSRAYQNSLKAAVCWRKISDRDNELKSYKTANLILQQRSE